MINLHILSDFIESQEKYRLNEPWHDSICAERLNWVGHQLTKPGSQWLTDFARVSLLDFKPGWWGQKSTVNREKLHRIALAVYGIAALPVVFLPVALGSFMRSFASAFKKDFVYQSPAVEKELESTGDSFRVLSFNTLLMPEFLTMRNKHRPTMERVHDVAYAVIQSQADIVCLQEVFHTEAAEILAEKLRAQGYYVVYNIAHKIFGLNSGLFLASKRALNDIAFYPHPDWKVGADQYANKGLLLATVIINNKRYVIGNTHLNGGGSKDGFRSYTCRALQGIKITDHIDEYVREKNQNFDGIVLGADTNISLTDHDHPRDSCNQNRKTPVLEPEWFLAEKLYHSGLSFMHPDQNQTEGFRFRNTVKTMYEDLENFYKAKYQLSGSTIIAGMGSEGLQRLINERCHMGGPFPTSLYKHDLQKPNNYHNVIRGSTVDLEALPGVGWGDEAVDQPERVDFVMVRKEHHTVNGCQIKEPELLNVEIIPLRNEKNQLVSDHYGVLSEISFKN